jgi:hypothetical protein
MIVIYPFGVEQDPFLLRSNPFNLVGLLTGLINTTMQQGVINIYYYYPELHKLYSTFVNASYIYMH